MLKLARKIVSMEKVCVRLMYSRAMDNHKFFQKVVTDFYKESTARHSKFFVIKQMTVVDDHFANNARYQYRCFSDNFAVTCRQFNFATL